MRKDQENQKKSKEEMRTGKKKNFFYRHSYTIAILAVILSIAGGGFFFWNLSARKDDSTTAAEAFVSADGTFEQFTDQIFKQWVQKSSIDLHYTLVNPEAYGIEQKNAVWGDISEEGMIQYYKELENIQNEMKKFDYQNLSDSDQLTYDVLNGYLDTERKGKDLYLYQELLSPLTGIQSQTPIFLTEYELKTVKDVETYLDLCKKLPEYFNQVIQFEQEKSKAGLFMSDSVLDEIIAQCEQFLADSGNNILISSFEERVAGLAVSEEQRQTYCEQNKQIVNNNIFSAYRNLIDQMNKLRSSGTNEGGLSNYKNGKEYYEYVTESNTGSSDSVEEIKANIQTAIFDDLSAAAKLLQSDSTIAEKASNAVYPSSDPTVILQQLQNKIQEDFPALEDTQCEIKTVSASLQEYLSPAFYIPPPVDNTDENVIYINENPDYDLTKIYPTIAHEGYPGHLYQNVYFRQNNSNNIRKLLSFLGYTEGWAVYCEYLSYEMMDTISAPVQSYLQHISAATLGIHAWIDIGIHYEGWDISKVKEFVQNYFGEVSEDSVRELYYNIVEEPANYLSYYVGYLNILELKAQTEEALGEQFTLKQFHQKLLDIGPAPFDVIAKYLLK